MNRGFGNNLQPLGRPPVSDPPPPPPSSSSSPTSSIASSENCSDTRVARNAGGNNGIDALFEARHDEWVAFLTRGLTRARLQDPGTKLDQFLPLARKQFLAQYTECDLLLSMFADQSKLRPEKLFYS